MTVRILVLLLLWLCPLCLHPSIVRAACVTDSQAAIPLRVIGGAIIAPVEVNGQPASFILDTGAERSVVTQAAVTRLGIARDEWVGTTMRGVGGIERRPNANPRSLSLGGVPLVRHTLNQDTSLTVGVLPRTRAGDLVIDGLLGRDFLSRFDLDLDVPGRGLTLYRVTGCSGRFLPWNAEYAAVPIVMPAAQAIIVPVVLDGQVLRALLDTGASASMVAAPGIFRLGLTPDALAGDPADQISGLGPRMLTVHRHRFRSMQVGGQIINDPDLWVEPVRIGPIVDMLLGADWLAGRRVWISFATRQLFVRSE